MNKKVKNDDFILIYLSQDLMFTNKGLFNLTSQISQGPLDRYPQGKKIVKSNWGILNSHDNFFSCIWRIFLHTKAGLKYRMIKFTINLRINLPKKSLKKIKKNLFRFFKCVLKGDTRVCE